MVCRFQRLAILTRIPDWVSEGKLYWRIKKSVVLITEIDRGFLLRFEDFFPTEIVRLFFVVFSNCNPRHCRYGRIFLASSKDFSCSVEGFFLLRRRIFSSMVFLLPHGIFFFLHDIFSSWFSLFISKFVLSLWTKSVFFRPQRNGNTLVPQISFPRPFDKWHLSFHRVSPSWLDKIRSNLLSNRLRFHLSLMLNSSKAICRTWNDFGRHRTTEKKPELEFIGTESGKTATASIRMRHILRVVSPPSELALVALCLLHGWFFIFPREPGISLIYTGTFSAASSIQSVFLLARVHTHTHIHTGDTGAARHSLSIIILFLYRFGEFACVCGFVYGEPYRCG